MNIAYLLPLRKAWDRMVTMLFRPFDLGKWIVLAFVVFVAGLLDGGGAPGGGGGDKSGGFHPGGGGHVPDASSILAGLRRAWEGFVEAYHWLFQHTAVAVIVFVVIPLVIAIILAVIWLTSRFKFIYIDNVVWNRAAVSEPWRRLRPLGDSLFLFRVAFGLAAFVGGVFLVGGLVGLGVYCLAHRAVIGCVGLGFLGMVTVAYTILVIYASLFLESFVVPIMYRFNITAMQAWRTFLPYFSAYTGHFLLYGLYVLALFIVVGLALMVVILATCCIPLLILMFPCIGPFLRTLVLLPLLVTYRLLSLEFLAQFDPSLDIFATAQAQATAVPEGIA